MVQAFKSYLMAAVPGGMAGGLVGLIDAKLLSSYSTLIRILAKVGIAAGFGLAFRSRPTLAAATIGGVVGTIGYEQAVAFTGGVVAPTPAAAVKGINALIREDPQGMGVLIRGMRGLGLGAQLDNSVSLGGTLAPRYVDTNMG